MTLSGFDGLPICPICDESIYDNQDSICGDDNETYHADCFNDSPDLSDPDETMLEIAEA